MSNTISASSLLSAFPYALSVDEAKQNLADSIATELNQMYQDNDELSIYTRLSELDEEMLDILAKDFKIDWYIYDGTIESKRAQIQSCFYVHRHLGTMAALNYAISDLCPDSTVEEWYEYSGYPYYFRIIVNTADPRLPVSEEMVERLVNIVKPARAVLDSIQYMNRKSTETTMYIGNMLSSVYKKIETEVAAYELD